MDGQSTTAMWRIVVPLLSVATALAATASAWLALGADESVKSLREELQASAASASEETQSGNSGIRTALAEASVRTQTLEDSVRGALASIALLREESRADAASLRQNLQSVDSSIRTALAEATARTQTLEGSVRRALANIVVDTPPADLVDALRAATTRWLPAAKPAEMPENSESIRAELDVIRSSMTERLRWTGTRELRMLDWWADVIDLVGAPVDDPSQAPSLFLAASELARSAPVRAPRWSFETLSGFRLRLGLGVLKERLSSPRLTQEDVDSIESLLSDLFASTANSEPGAATELASLQQQLAERRGSVRVANIESDLLSLQEDRNRVLGLSDARLRLQLLAGVEGQLHVLMAAAVGTSVQATIEDRIRAWRRETETLAASLRRRDRLQYQAWALRQMENFVPAYASHEATWGDNYTEQANEIIRFLCPIDDNLLEPPIRKKYTALWDGMFDSVDEPNQRRILEHLSREAKKDLGEV